MKLRCGGYHSIEERTKMKIHQDSMYNAYRKDRKVFKRSQITTIPNWRPWMGPVEDQTCGNCWAQAAVGITEGQLQIYLGNNVGIDLDEMFITNYSGGGSCSGGYISTALNYIKNSRVPVEPGYTTFPKFSGVKYSLSSVTFVRGISNIKTALENGPVSANFDVYEDFNGVGIYRYNGTADYIGGHSVVIVSYNDDQEYWVCKNSWGSAWGDNGYFKIGYGQCGIETYENYSVSVDQSSLAKIVPQFYSSLNDVMGSNFSIPESAYLTGGTQTLDNNISINAGVTLTLKSGSYIDYANYGILNNNGTINFESGANSNVKVFLKDNSAVKGYFAKAQPAINSSLSGQTVELTSGTYNEAINVSNKQGTTITGVGDGTVINNNVNLSWNSNLTIQDIKINPGYRISQSGGSVNINNLNTDDNSTTPMSIYGGNFNINNWSSNSSSGQSIDPCLLLNTSGGGSLNNSSLSYQELGISVGGGVSSFFENNQFCSNGYDLMVTSGCAVLHGNSFSRDSVSSVYSNGGMIVWHGNPYTCTNGFAKRSVMPKSNTSSIQSHPGYVEYARIDSAFLNLLGKNSKENKNADSGNDDLRKILSDYQIIINKYSKTELAALCANKIANCFISTNNWKELKSYIDTVKNNAKYGTANIERYLVDYYINQNEFTKAVEIADEIISKSERNLSFKAEMLYEKGLLKKYLLNDEIEADKYFSLAKGISKDDILLNLISYQLGYKESLKKQSETNNLNEIDFELSSYPNPFNPITTISFVVPFDMDVEVKVYNQIGQEVKNYGQKLYHAGKYEISFDGSKLSSGVYYARFSTGSNVKYIKMMLLK